MSYEKRQRRESSAQEYNQAPKDAQWDQMEAVDYLLLNEPMLKAPLDFADKVLSAITAGRQSRINHDHRQRMALSLALSVILLAPLMIAAVFTIQHWVADPASFQWLLQQIWKAIITLLTGVSQLVAQLFQLTATYITSGPIEFMLLTTLLPVMVMWMLMMNYTTQRRQQIVYRIPVRVL